MITTNALLNILTYNYCCLLFYCSFIRKFIFGYIYFLFLLKGDTISNNNNLNYTIKDVAHEYSKFFGMKTRFFIKCRPYMCPLFDILPFIQENAESMLDLGCGTGLLLYCSFKLKKVQNAVGIDVDSNFINLLNNTFSKFNSTHYKFFSRDNYKFWPQETFNIVSMIDLLHHLKKHDQITYFKEAAKRVKSNGIFIVKDMLNRPKFYGLMNTINDLIFSRQLANYPDLDQLVSEISADFKVIFSNQTRLLWYMHRLIVLQKY